MIFSALVDADFLATETFMASDRAVLRRKPGMMLLPRMLELLERRIAEFPAPENEVDCARANVHAQCASASANSPGLFSLTVPTGGGKTLASLGFALRHAIKHGQRRVIYVIPFTSIIEQNAGEFEKVFRTLIASEPDPVVLQHHSNLSPEKETERSRLAAENWEAPLVVTTAVQFYESLHASRTYSCRKLHNIANSAVILDEAQCLPVEYLRPCLDVLPLRVARARASATPFKAQARIWRQYLPARSSSGCHHDELSMYHWMVSSRPSLKLRSGFQSNSRCAKEESIA
jgi:CRISPR-associated endonuclease/helicase Cas3